MDINPKWEWVLRSSVRLNSHWNYSDQREFSSTKGYRIWTLATRYRCMGLLLSQWKLCRDLGTDIGPSGSPQPCLPCPYSPTFPATPLSLDYFQTTQRAEPQITKRKICSWEKFSSPLCSGYRQLTPADKIYIFLNQWEPFAFNNSYYMIGKGRGQFLH